MSSGGLVQKQIHLNINIPKSNDSESLYMPRCLLGTTDMMSVGIAQAHSWRRVVSTKKYLRKISIGKVLVD
jgi:hypothetical protein